MKNYKVLFLLCFFQMLIFYQGQLLAQCENRCLDFDGIDDFITRSPSPILGNSNFTVEMWFRSTATGGLGDCNMDFRRLFAFYNTALTSRFEIGECTGRLSFFWRNGPANGPFTMSATSIRDGDWHHLAVVRTGSTVEAFLDCVSIYTYSGIGTLATTRMSVGNWSTTIDLSSSWQGQIDEVRVWNQPKTLADIMTTKHCLLKGTEPGLVTYWQFDQGMAGADNQLITQVTDATSLNQNGTLTGFTLLPGSVSNFICSDADLIYPNLQGADLELRGQLPSSSGLLPEICSGDPVHFCVLKDGVTPQPPPGMTVEWQFSDDGSPWQPVLHATDPDFFQAGSTTNGKLCFAAQHITAICTAANPDGFTDRKYRANITLNDPMLGNCTYTSDEYALKICCPIPASTMNITVLPAGLLNGTLCEGDVADFTVTLSPAPFTGAATTIKWYRDGVYQPSLDNLASFTAPGITVFVPSICFKANVSHCSKSTSFESCIVVDPMPSCGTIEKSPTCTTLQPLNTPCVGSTICYLICPGDDATLYEFTPFNNCFEQWQYTFDHVTWFDLGYTNEEQNTNELPGDWPWPAGMPPIFYRIKCLPKHMPSGCEPCYSNEVRIEFIQPPAADVITGLTQICSSTGGTLLSMAAPDPAFTYTWYYNGLEVQSGPSSSYFAAKDGCYWVDISNGCQVTQTAWHCLRICELIAAITCPLPPNDCAFVGLAIELDACIATSNSCGGNPNTFSYSWTWTDNLGNPQTASSCSISDTPALTGTSYSVTVTDPATGCTDTATETVLPCQN